MKQIQYILLTLVAIFLVACQADEEMLSDKGYLSFAIGQDISVTTKAEDYNPELLALKISDSTGKEIKTETGSVEELNALKIELVAGEYTVEVYSNNYDGNSAFGENGAYYYGSTKVSVTKGTTVTANITCTLANVKVTVNFDTQLVGQLGGKTITAQVTSKTQSVTARDFSSANTENKVAFFPVGDLNVAIAIMNGDTKEHDLTHEITEVKARDHYILNIKLQETGTENITVQVDPSMQEYSYEFTVSQKPTNQGTLSANAWAKFAYLTAENVTSASGIDLSTLKIQYRQKNTETWATAETTVADNVYSAIAMNLKPATTYEYRLTDGLEIPVFNISGGEFTTEAATVLPNAGFEDWSVHKAGTATASVNTTFPCTDDEYNNGTRFWDTSNRGANSIGQKDPTNKTEKLIHGGTYAAKLGTTKVAGKLAAASLYSGDFIKADMSGTATINFGKPFVSRPTALKGYYKYTPVKASNTGALPDGVTLTDDLDQCAIYVVLMKGGEQHEVINTKTETLLSLDNIKADDKFIAYGELSSGAATAGDGFVEFNIPIEYRNLDDKPTHIIVVCSASKYGDYMVGGDGSTMYLDDLELVYDGEPQKWDL